MKNISIITGGNSGLGFSIAKKLVSQGQNVCIIGRDIHKLEAVHKELTSMNKGEVLYYSINVSDEDSVKMVFDSLGRSNYIVSYLFNTAGAGRFAPPDSTTRSAIDEVLEANLIGLILMSTYALRSMKKNGGTIINIMSSSSRKVNPMESLYCAAKWGARGYSDALRAAAKGTNIKVVSVYPGGMNTPFWKPDWEAPVDPDKFMDPDEVAEQIVDAVSNKTSMYVSEIMIDRKS